MSSIFPAFEFVLFGATLLGIALFHRRTLQVSLVGLTAIAVYKLAFTGFPAGPGLSGLGAHLGHEWVVLANLLGLLLGFALLSSHFERSRVPAILPRFLPDDWKGGLALLAAVFVLSSFLDNIAAAVIGGTVAGTVFRGRVHIGYLAAIVAASNAGGAGSVVGDTTTTMMWIAGVDPVDVLRAYIASFAAFAIFAVPAAIQQQRHSPIMKDAPAAEGVDWARVTIVAIMLVAAITANVVVNLHVPELAARFPFIAAVLWLALLACAPWRRPDWSVLPEAFRGSVFLLALVVSASMMPVEQLPPASWQLALSLGFVSAVFDNIPLTALALRQGGFDWGLLAYAVGFGGSMLWFGSSAGVALANLYPQAKSAWDWLRHGWYVAIAYVVGFCALLALLGWEPGDARKSNSAPISRAVQVYP